MEQVLGYIGDGLWIAALAIMASSTRQAWKRIPPGARIQVASGLTAAKGPALLAVPVLAFVVGVALSLARIWADQNPLAAIALFTVRVGLPALFAMAHLRWLAMALEQTGRTPVQRP